MSLPVLSAEEQRVLGCLLEKQRTVPASYPLSLNALRLACNQSNSRDPIVDYDERTIQDTARSLKDRHLLRLVWAGAGSRTVKYHQLLEEELALTAEHIDLIGIADQRHFSNARRLPRTLFRKPIYELDPVSVASGRRPLEHAHVRRHA